MEDYQLQELSGFDKTHIQEGVFLVLLDALAVPPHLLLVVAGKVFSISTLGPALDQDFDKYERLIHKRRLPTVFIKLALPAIFTQEMLLDKVRAITRSYPRVDVGIATCLSPIKDFCGEVYHLDKRPVKLVFDLLDGLKAQQAIESYHHLFLEEEIRNGSISLNRYSVFEVNEAIYSAKIG